MRSDEAAPRPTEAEIAEARSRANVIVWGAWWLATLGVVAVFLTHDRWVNGLLAGVIFGCALIQHHAIKAARLLGHGKHSIAGDGAK